MKKNIYKIAIVAVIAAITGIGVYQAQQANIEMSDVMLANVEALARYELPEVDVTCDDGGGVCWAVSGECYVSWFIHYPDCEFCGYTSSSCQTPC